MKKAIFAGGCFWCVEHAFDEVPGVISTISGYIGGHIKNPSYSQVSGGDTGHIEAVEISYDANKVSYQKLLSVFWRNIDPTDAKGQFCDKGYQYTSAIFYLNNSQRKLAEISKKEILNNKNMKKYLHSNN
nr:peptide-methionine (S)-S-oxide reductase MsrA [Piscirickettsia litoralis]